LLKRNLLLAVSIAGVAAMATETAAREDRPNRSATADVEAPGTRVIVRERDGDAKVRVRAPHTRVDVDTVRGHVRVRVPYYSGDIRW
jgi:hypothetical protein